MMFVTSSCASGERTTSRLGTDIWFRRFALAEHRPGVALDFGEQCGCERDAFAAGKLLVADRDRGLESEETVALVEELQRLSNDLIGALILAGFDLAADEGFQFWAEGNGHRQGSIESPV